MAEGDSSEKISISTVTLTLAVSGDRSWLFDCTGYVLRENVSDLSPCDQAIVRSSVREILRQEADADISHQRIEIAKRFREVFRQQTYDAIGFASRKYDPKWKRRFDSCARVIGITLHRGRKQVTTMPRSPVKRDWDHVFKFSGKWSIQYGIKSKWGNFFTNAASNYRKRFWRSAPGESAT